jgi:hypothetical protein
VDGVRTVRTAVGTVSDIDVDAGTSSLVLKDSSETIQYEIDTETKVTIQQSGELSGLNTEDLTTVIDYKDNDGLWKVKSVSQGGHRDYTGLKRHKRLRGFGGIFPGRGRSIVSSETGRRKLKVSTDFVRSDLQASSSRICLKTSYTDSKDFISRLNSLNLEMKS